MVNPILEYFYKKYISPYFIIDNINIQLWEGSIHLTNLQSIPINIYKHIINIKIEDIKIYIPWKNIEYERIYIIAKGITIDINKHNNNDYKDIENSINSYKDITNDNNNIEDKTNNDTINNNNTTITNDNDIIKLISKTIKEIINKYNINISDIIVNYCNTIRIRLEDINNYDDNDTITTNNTNTNTNTNTTNNNNDININISIEMKDKGRYKYILLPTTLRIKDREYIIIETEEIGIMIDKLKIIKIIKLINEYNKDKNDDNNITNNIITNNRTNTNINNNTNINDKILLDIKLLSFTLLKEYDIEYRLDITNGIISINNILELDIESFILEDNKNIKIIDIRSLYINYNKEYTRGYIGNNSTDGGLYGNDITTGNTTSNINTTTTDNTIHNTDNDTKHRDIDSWLKILKHYYNVVTAGIYSLEIPLYGMSFSTLFVCLRKKDIKKINRYLCLCLEECNVFMRHGKYNRRISNNNMSNYNNDKNIIEDVDRNNMNNNIDNKSISNNVDTDNMNNNMSSNNNNTDNMNNNNDIINNHITNNNHTTITTNNHRYYSTIEYIKIRYKNNIMIINDIEMLKDNKNIRIRINDYKYNLKIDNIQSLYKSSGKNINIKIIENNLLCKINEIKLCNRNKILKSKYYIKYNLNIVNDNMNNNINTITDNINTTTINTDNMNGRIYSKYKDKYYKGKYKDFKYKINFIIKNNKIDIKSKNINVYELSILENNNNDNQSIMNDIKNIIKIERIGIIKDEQLFYTIESLLNFFREIEWLPIDHDKDENIIENNNNDNEYKEGNDNNNDNIYININNKGNISIPISNFVIKVNNFNVIYNSIVVLNISGSMFLKNTKNIDIKVNGNINDIEVKIDINKKNRILNGNIDVDGRIRDKLEYNTIIIFILYLLDIINLIINKLLDEDIIYENNKDKDNISIENIEGNNNSISINNNIEDNNISLENNKNNNKNISLENIKDLEIILNISGNVIYYNLLALECKMLLTLYKLKNVRSDFNKEMINNYNGYEYMLEGVEGNIDILDIKISNITTHNNGIAYIIGKHNIYFMKTFIGFMLTIEIDNLICSIPLESILLLKNDIINIDLRIYGCNMKTDVYVIINNIEYTLYKYNNNKLINDLDNCNNNIEDINIKTDNNDDKTDNIKINDIDSYGIKISNLVVRNNIITFESNDRLITTDIKIKILSESMTTSILISVNNTIIVTDNINEIMFYINYVKEAINNYNEYINYANDDIKGLNGNGFKFGIDKQNVFVLENDWLEVFLHKDNDLPLFKIEFTTLKFISNPVNGTVIINIYYYDAMLLDYILFCDKVCIILYTTVIADDKEYTSKDYGYNSIKDMECYSNDNKKDNYNDQKQKVVFKVDNPVRIVLTQELIKVVSNINKSTRDFIIENTTNEFIRVIDDSLTRKYKNIKDSEDKNVKIDNNNNIIVNNNRKDSDDEINKNIEIDNDTKKKLHDNLVLPHSQALFNRNIFYKNESNINIKDNKFIFDLRSSYSSVIDDYSKYLFLNISLDNFNRKIKIYKNIVINNTSNIDIECYIGDNDVDVSNYKGILSVSKKNTASIELNRLYNNMRIKPGGYKLSIDTFDIHRVVTLAPEINYEAKIKEGCFIAFRDDNDKSDRNNYNKEFIRLSVESFVKNVKGYLVYYIIIYSKTVFKNHSLLNIEIDIYDKGKCIDTINVRKNESIEYYNLDNDHMLSAANDIDLNDNQSDNNSIKSDKINNNSIKNDKVNNSFIKNDEIKNNEIKNDKINKIHLSIVDKKIENISYNLSDEYKLSLKNIKINNSIISNININQLVYIIYKEFIFINNLKESIYIDRILIPGITECSLEYYCNAIKIEGYEESKEIIFSMSQTQVIKVKRKKSYKNKHKEIENRDKNDNDNIVNDYDKNNNLKNTGNLSFLNILVDIKKIKNTFVVKIEYANFLINNTKYGLRIKVDDCTLVFGINERKELSIGKNEGFYVLYEENKDKNNNECLNGDKDRVIEDNTENYSENNSQISEIEGQVSNMTGIDINSTKRYNKFFIPTKTIGKKYFYLIIKDKRHLFSVNIIIRSKQRTFTIVEKSKWPILIKNMMDNEIRFNQHNVKNKHIVAPLSSYYYTFDILDDNLFLDFSIGNKKIKHKANGVKKDGSVKINSVIINNREIIEVMDSKAEIKNKRDNILFLGEIIIRRLSISLIDKEKNNDTEFLAAHFKTVKLICIKKEIENEDSFEVKLSVIGMQIDNQEYTSNFPIILHPVNPYLYVNAKKNRDLHFLQCNFEINSFKPLKIKYFVFLVQEFTLMIEEDIAKRILIFFNLDEIEQQIDIYTYLQQMGMEYNNIFINIKTFHIFPVKLRFSFIKSEKKGLVSNVLSLILKNISNLNLRFNTIILIDVDVDMKSLQNIIFTEYKSQLLIQMINIIASLDFLGNIGNLIDSFSLGIHDFFYEPYLGFVSNDPQKITTGILKGSKSFIKNTVAGVNNTMLKMFKSIGSVIQLATFEKTEQRICIPYHNDKYLLINIESDTYNPISDIVDGLTGLIKKPVDGAKKGVKGFFKGIGKGIAGVIAKPIVGIVGFSTKITEAVKDMVEEKIERVEYPRAITCIKIEGKIVTIKEDNNEYGLYGLYDGYDDRRCNNEHKEYNINNTNTYTTPNSSTTNITSNNNTTNIPSNENNNIKEYKLSDTKPPPSPLSLYLSYNTNQSIGYYIFNILKDKEGFTTFNDSDIGILEDQRIQILIVDNKLFLINIYSMGNITDFNITEEGIVIGRHIVLVNKEFIERIKHILKK